MEYSFFQYEVFNVWYYFLLLVPSIIPQSWLETVFGEKPNIVVGFSIRANFQPICQFGNKRVVWNIEQVQMTCSGAADGIGGWGRGTAFERKMRRLKTIVVA